MFPVVFRSLAWLVVLALTFGLRALAQLPAFPGAEGFGAYAAGGRGGDVYHVTNLNNSGAGSFANGLATVPAAGRTIVFDVSGYVTFSGELRLTASKVTIAGQTAPGDGFGLKGGTFRVSGDDVIVRHIRMRNGVSADSLNLDSGSTRTIFDHIDVMLSNDENMSSFNSPPEDMTFQWSINAWGMESHSAGGLWDLNRGTTHHTLWSHNHTRNPKARPGLLDWVNNVTFDWDIGFIMGDSETPADWKANVRGCYFVCPPGNVRSVALEKARIDRNGGRNFSLYLDDSHMDQNGNGLLDVSKSGYAIASGSYVTLPAPVPLGGGIPVTQDGYLTAYKKVVSAVGPLRLESDASKPLRDELNTRLLSNLVTQTRHHVSSPSGTGATNGGYGTLLSSAAPPDADGDGMPNPWETALGWNAGTQDHNTVVGAPNFFPAGTAAGYTRIEEYLHFLAVPHATVAKSTAAAPSSIDLDLRKFTSGFASSPVFTLAGVTGGVATQSGAGGALVHFAPTPETFGRAGFNFTVTDSAGSTWTQQFALLISAAGVPRDLLWQGGAASNAWNTTTLNWLRSSTPTAFAVGDNVLFNDLGSNSPAINLVGALAPGAVTVDAAKSFTFTGSGSLGTSGALTKRGAGALTLSNTGANGFGAVTLDEGALTLSSATSAGNAPIAWNGGVLNVNASINNALVISDAVTLNVGGTQTLGGAWSGAGTVTANIGNNTLSLSGSTSAFAGRLGLGASTGFLRFNGSTGSAAATFDLGTSSADLLSRNGGVTIHLGALEGGPNTAVTGASSAGNATTYSIGANGNDSTFAGAMTNGGFSAAATTNIVKVGSGVLTLTGTSTYTGTTTISAGSLAVNGALGNTAITIESGATLRGIGTIAGAITAETGSKISPGPATLQIGTLHVGNALTLAASTISMQLSANPASGNDAIVMSGGTLAMSGEIDFDFSLVGGALGAGTYELITGAANSTASGVSFTHNLPAGTRQTHNLFRPAAGANPSFIKLTVTGSPAALTWTGAGGGIWDLNTTPGNWSGGPTSTFFNLDLVNFTDSSAVGAVSLAGTLAPNVVNVTNATTAYTFSGSGLLAGTARLVKSGAGTLTIANSGANTFTGGTTLNAGTLAFGAGASPLGTGAVAIQGGALGLGASSLANSLVFTGTSALTSTANVTIVSSTANTLSSAGNATVSLAGINGILTINGPMSGFNGTLALGTGSGMLRLNGSANANFGSASTLFDLGTGAATLANRNGGITISLGAVQGGPNTTLQGRQSGSGVTESTYLVGGSNTDATFAGRIVQGGDQQGVNIVKVGTGKWTLSGVPNFTGAVSVQTGRLAIAGALTITGNADAQAGATLELASGTLTAEAVNIAAGAQLTGAGTIAGDLNNNGLVTGGPLTVNGDIVNNGVLRITSGAGFSAGGSFINNGTLDLLTSSAPLPANLVNNGVIIDSSSLRTASVARSGPGVAITVLGYAGHTYQLQRADSLPASMWANIGAAQAGAGAPLVFNDPLPPADSRFYRIHVTP